MTVYSASSFSCPLPIARTVSSRARARTMTRNVVRPTGETPHHGVLETGLIRDTLGQRFLHVGQIFMGKRPLICCPDSDCPMWDGCSGGWPPPTDRP